MRVWTLSSLLKLLVAGLLQLRSELGATGLDDLAVSEYVYKVRNDVVEDALVVGNHQDATVGFFLVGIDAVGNDTQCVNVQTRVGLIHDSELWLEQIKLHNLVALLLATGEAFVDGTSNEGLIDMQTLTSFLKLVVPLTQLRCFTAYSGNSGAHELAHLHASNLSWVLHSQEEARACALVDLEVEDVFAVEQYFALGNLVARVTSNDVGQGGLAGAVRAHDGVGLTGVNGQVNALENWLWLCAFLA